MSEKSNKFFTHTKEKQDELGRRVDRAQNFDEIFELVKRVVEEEIGEHRAGLTLVLANMPSTVGAYHPMGANIIVVNKSLINGMQQVTRNPKEINAFVFMVLLHEYLHSLGYADEGTVRKIAQRVSRNALGESHPTVKLANANWLELYPQLQSLSQQPFSREFEVVQKFDSSSTSYIG
ncbi:MAG: hypothetical protein OK439_00365 [Thaumarchaeota archaeon]|nr:hypothetical protein [Nitrososphaerota archaeon]